MVEFVDDFSAILSGQSWSGADGAPTVVTYSFETEAQDYLGDIYSQDFIDSFSAYSSQMEQLAVQAFDIWAAASGITFVEVAPGEGDIRMGNFEFAQNDPPIDFTGFGYYPSRSVSEYSSYESEISGDIFFNSARLNRVDLDLMMHEIGHAIGLEHPFDGDVQLLDAYDNGTYTVMSYDRGNISTLGLFDVEATEHLYGAPSFVPSATGGVTDFGYDALNQIVIQTWGDAASEIFGTSLSDVIDAGAGDDSVSGFRGDDMVFGGAGDDAVFGGAGDDTVMGGAGNDRLYGGSYSGDPEAGSNTVSYADVFSGVTATLVAGVWNGSMYVYATGADSGEDAFYNIQHLIGGWGADHFTGDDGDNSLLGGFGFDTIEGGLGNDTIDGEGNADRLYGGGGNDQIVGGDGTDHLYGDAGNDSLFGDSGADRLFGGDGDDLIRAGTNFGTSVDGAEGGAGNDTMFGDGGYDLLLGGTGDDWIDGGNQADNLYGDEGNDTIYGGAGFDRLFGGADDDLLIDNSGIGTFFGGTGNDTMQGGGTEATRFFGGQGNDVVEAGSGDDTIGGNAGFDTIDSGAGNDLIYGDFNADTFVFNEGHGQDTIADFDAFNDFEQIDLSGLAGMSLGSLNLGSGASGDAIQSGSDVVISTGGGNTITLIGVNIADLGSADFIF
ncbi:hypothetical protein DZK27_05305 [Rhodobacteraceae bacterium 63075]|nr:hypothetical protein DZK27_05305 [Rhodobacteraceae bacterium 63075]